METQSENLPRIRGHLQQIAGLIDQIRALLPEESDPRRHPEAQGEYSLPKGTQDALQWAGGRPNPNTGAPVPLTDPARQHLLTMARERGSRGLAWIPAIERAETMTDGKDLQERLREILPTAGFGSGK